MKRKEGFTLIELLVVMAIIAILAAIVVPNVVGWIGRARMTRAQAEIESIQTALAKLLTDASRNSLNDLINPDKFRAEVETLVRNPGSPAPAPPGPFDLENGKPVMTSAHFRAIQWLYTNTFYALLRSGRDARKAIDPDYSSVSYADFLRDEAIKQLGTTYLDIGFDPWGQNLYQIFPAPWKRGSTDYPNPMIFRTYLRPTPDDRGLPGAVANEATDGLEWPNEDEGSVGYPAPRSPNIAFIYSYGANLISGQLVYRNQSREGSERLLYDDSQDEEFFGGGDDVNNWDATASWGRFYN